MTSSADSLDDCIDPSSVAWKAVEVTSQSSKTAIDQALQLHRFCFEEIEYQRYENLRPPRDVLESGEGDCTDQTVLLSSLLLSRGIPVTVVHVQDHLFSEVLLPVQPSEELDIKIQQFYNLPKETDVRVVGANNTHPEFEESAYWYPVDPVMSRYLGDFQIHSDEDLVVKRDDKWDWNQLNFSKAYHSDSTPA